MELPKSSFWTASNPVYLYIDGLGCDWKEILVSASLIEFFDSVYNAPYE